MATQNPLEQEGTYPLPEAQVDRFMLKIIVGYPNRAEERAILDTMASTEPRARRHAGGVRRGHHRRAPRGQHHLYRRQGQGLHRGHGPGDARSAGATAWISTATFKTALHRAPPSISPWPPAPRHSSNGRGYVTPQDVKDLALDVLRHRVIVSYEAEAENITAEDIITKILETLPVP